MNGDDPSKLPLSFYGQSYLGRPVNVSVTGESPLGVPAGGPAAIAAGAAPPGAPSEAPTDAIPGATPGTAPSTTGIRDALRGLQGAGQAAKLGELASQGGAALSGFPISPSDVPYYGFDPDTLASLGSGEFSQFQTGIPGSEGTGTAGGASGLLSGAGLTAGAGLARLGLSFSDDPNATRASTAIGLAGIPGGFFFPPAFLLAMPELQRLAMGQGLAGFSPPPGVSFPADTWQGITGAVQGNLPQEMPVPSMASPEQRAAIEASNAEIRALREGYPTGTTTPESLQAGGMPQWLADMPAVQQATDLPPYLQGRQSPETWTNTMNTIKANVEGGFGRLSDLYPKAQQAQMGSYTDFLAGQANQVPSRGAPAGLLEELGTPLGKLTDALSRGDFAAAEAAIKGYPTDPGATLARYAPQLEAAKELPSGFYLGDEKQKELTA